MSAKSKKTIASAKSTVSTASAKANPAFETNETAPKAAAFSSRPQTSASAKAVTPPPNQEDVIVTDEQAGGEQGGLEAGPSGVGEGEYYSDYNYENAEVLPSVDQVNQEEQLPEDEETRPSSAAPIVKDENENEPKSGFLDGCTRCLRAMFATQLTVEERSKISPDLYLKATFRELIVYLFYLAVVLIIAFGMMNSNYYWQTYTLQRQFVENPVGDSTLNFQTIKDFQSYFMWLEGSLPDSLFWDRWYNNFSLPTDGTYIFFSNKILGMPRLRQLRVYAGSCSVANEMSTVIPTCYAPYSSSAADLHYDYMLSNLNLTTSSNSNTSAWQYHSPSEDEAGLNTAGYYQTYPAGGYYMLLPLNRTTAFGVFEFLRQNMWLDRGTRAVILDFTVYNGNINLFTIVKLLVEYPPTGGAITSYMFRTVKLLRYVYPWDYFVLACEIAFIAFLIYYTIEEILEMKTAGWKYWLSFWSYLEIIIVLLSTVCVIFDFYRYFSISEKLDSLINNKSSYLNFEFLAYWDVQFNNIIAVLVFFSWLKMFKYVSFNKAMSQLKATMMHCAGELIGFAFMFFVIFFSFAQFGNLVFGYNLADYRSFIDTVFTLFRLILGDFDFPGLQNANPVLGPLYFVTYVFFVFFILLNMFLAIINDTYGEVKHQIAEKHAQLELAKFFKQRYSKTIAKLRGKRDRINDIQTAIDNAVTEAARRDGVVDLPVLRSQLKMKGYPEAEIEAAFARFDVDGDRKISSSDLKKMRNELEQQARDLQNEMNEAENKHKEAEEKAKNAANEIGDQNISVEDFALTRRRVDQLETNIAAVVARIDKVLVKMETMERAKAARREALDRLLRTIISAEENSGSSEQADETPETRAKREELRRMVSTELEEMEGIEREGSAATSSKNSSIKSGVTRQPSALSAKSSGHGASASKGAWS